MFLETKEIKAKITFNNKQMLIPISEDFYTEYRVLEEMASMVLEQNFTLEQTELERQYDLVEEKFQDKLISLIEKKFKKKIKKDCFYYEDYKINKENLEKGIVIIADCYD
jgi:hypothetical protein